MNHSPMDHGLTRRGEVFIIFAQASAVVEPAQGLLDGTALLDDHKSLGTVSAFRNLQADRPLRAQRPDPGNQWPGIGPVGPEMPPSRTFVLQDRQQTLRAVAVLDTSGRHGNREDQPQRIDEEVVLAAFDLLVRIKAVGPLFRGLDRLPVDDACTRLASLGQPDITAEQVVHQLPGAILGLLAKAIIDNPPRGRS